MGETKKRTACCVVTKLTRVGEKGFCIQRQLRIKTLSNVGFIEQARTTDGRTDYGKVNPRLAHFPKHLMLHVVKRDWLAAHDQLQILPNVVSKQFRGMVSDA